MHSTRSVTWLFQWLHHDSLLFMFLFFLDAMLFRAVFLFPLLNVCLPWTQAIVRQQVEHQEWGAYAHRLLTPEERLWRNPSNGGHDDKAHPPIHPTKFSRGENNWSPDHKVCSATKQQINQISLCSVLQRSLQV